MTAPLDGNMLGKIMSYEEGTLSDEGTIELFRHLVDSGLAWQLQGSYGRTANDLIERGLINTPTIKHCDTKGKDNA